MAALLPILQEILPMLMPGSVHVTKAEELQGPPKDAVPDPLDYGDDEDEEGEYDEAGFDGEDEDDESDEGEATETQPRTEVQPEPQSAARGVADGSAEGEGIAADEATSNVKEAKEGDEPTETIPKVNSDGDASTEILPLRPAPVPIQPPSKDTKKEKKKGKGKDKAKSRRSHLTNHARKLPHYGVSLRDAIVHKSGSLCASVLTVKPQCSTVVFHNGEQEAIVYAVSGTAILATLPEDFDEVDEDDNSSTSTTARKPPATTTISAGDFAFIPAWTEHQVRNEAAADNPESKDVVWVVVRNAGEPTVVPLQGWGGEHAE